ncbi:Proline iminopeptidase-like protein [Drosera capensis]
MVPLDYDASEGRVISVFARDVVAAGREDDELPYLLYLQGEPGFESPCPTHLVFFLFTPRLLPLHGISPTSTPQASSAAFLFLPPDP